MNGPECPICQQPMEWLTTSNEWVYACLTCDRRFNRRLEPMPPPETWPPGYGRTP